MAVSHNISRTPQPICDTGGWLIRTRAAVPDPLHYQNRHMLSSFLSQIGPGFRTYVRRHRRPGFGGPAALL